MIFFTGWQALRKKGRVDDLQTSLLEEVLKSYFLANETRIPDIRNSEDWSTFPGCSQHLRVLLYLLFRNVLGFQGLTLEDMEFMGFDFFWKKLATKHFLCTWTSWIWMYQGESCVGNRQRGALHSRCCEVLSGICIFYVCSNVGQVNRIPCASPRWKPTSCFFSTSTPPLLLMGSQQFRASRLWLRLAGDICTSFRPPVGWCFWICVQVTFFKLAQYHGFFAPKTKNKVIKD